MAFESKTELKARVATNKLEANLLNNMIDSMVSLESDGDLVVDGDVQADSVTTSLVTTDALIATTADINGGTIDNTAVGATTPASVTATEMKVGNIRISDTVTAIGMNCEYDGADWKAVANGYCEYTLFDEATGLTSVYKTDIVASAGGTVTGDFNKVFERDRHGNTAEGGATLSGLTLDNAYSYKFNGLMCTQVDRVTGVCYTYHNAYLTGGTSLSLANTGSYCSYIVQTGSVFAIRQSTLVASAIAQPMIMTITITPS